MPITINTSPMKIRDNNNNFVNVPGITSLSEVELSQLADVEVNRPREGQTLRYLPIFDDNGQEVIDAKWVNSNPLPIMYGQIPDYENPVLYTIFPGEAEPETFYGSILNVLGTGVASMFIQDTINNSYNTIKRIENNSKRIICNNGDIFEVNQETQEFELVSSQGNTSQDAKLAYTYVSEHETNLLALINSNSDIISIDANDIQNYLESGNGKMFVTTYTNGNITYAIRELEYLRGFPRITLVNGDMFTVSSYIDDIPVYTMAGNEE